MENNKFENQKLKCSNYCCTKIENLSVTIGNHKILDDVNLHIHCGELTSIIGPNGAGKSTLLKAILGELPHTGTLNYLGSNIETKATPIIGYVPQYLNFDLSTPTSVLDLFAASSSFLPTWLVTKKNYKSKVLENLRKVNAEHLLNRKLGALSGGELQRVLLSLALDPIPNILLLDEPVSGIDQNGLDIFYSILMDIKAKYDLSIILVSHDLDLVYKYSDRVILLNKSVICNDSPTVVFNNPLTKSIFGLNVLRKSNSTFIEGGN